MHPDVVPGEDPGEDEHVPRAENNATGISPDKAGQRLKERVMQFNASNGAKR